MARSGQLHRAEGRRAGQRHHAVAGQHPATNDPASNGLSQSANYFETNANVLARSVARSRAARRPTTLDLAKLGRSTRIASTRWTCGSRRSSASAARAPTWASTSTTCSTPTPGTTLQPELRNRRLHVAASERDPEPAVRALQRDGGLLVDRTPTLTLGSSNDPGVREPPGSTPRASSTMSVASVHRRTLAKRRRCGLGLRSGSSAWKIGSSARRADDDAVALD